MSEFIKSLNSYKVQIDFMSELKLSLYKMFITQENKYAIFDILTTNILHVSGK